MVNKNTNAMGVIFPNSYDNLIPQMISKRTMASIPFAGRYRMVDFILSSMTNSGIDNVSIIVKRNYRSLMDHLGSGREWDLVRKRGGLNMVPPYAEAGTKMYRGRVEALATIMEYLKDQKEKYVVLSDSNLAMCFDFNALLDAHVASGADVTMVYQRTPVPTNLKGDSYTYTIRMDGTRVTELLSNDCRPGVQNLSMNIYVMERETLIQTVQDATVRDLAYFERDILARNLELLNVQAYEYTGYVARISDMRSYFEENMRLLENGNLDALFGNKNSIHTKIRDDAPTRYAMDCKVSNSIVADGCIIEGEVENCVLFRGVRVKKGAKVKNCVLMQDTVVESGAMTEYVITDKNVRITSDKQLNGTATFPVYVEKGQIV